jgi:hypothetical protein
MNIDRYLAIVRWATRRYTRDGLLLINARGVPSPFSRIECAAWNRYMGATS